LIVAITTVQLATIPKKLSFLDWLDDFLYLESMYIIILVWLIYAGPAKSAWMTELPAVSGIDGKTDRIC